MTIDEITRERGITEILHFTTHHGLTGILHQQFLKARNLVKDDDVLEFIREINTNNVFDADWKDFVNLSLTRINYPLFSYSKSQHPEHEWRILAFDPVVLGHLGVHFVTTNNAYWQHFKRGTGPEALEALFAQRVTGRYGKLWVRADNTPSNVTTDIQAEVLYPKEVSTRHLLTIYVPTEKEADSVASLFIPVGHREIRISVNKELFVSP